MMAGRRPVLAVLATAERPSAVPLTRRQVVQLGLGAGGLLPTFAPAQAADVAETTGVGRVQDACSSFTLDNGMRFVVLQRHSAPLVR